MPITTPAAVILTAPELAPLHVLPGPTRLEQLITDVGLLVDATAWGDKAEAAGRYLVAHVALSLNPQLARVGPTTSFSAGGVQRTVAVATTPMQAMDALDTTGYGQMYRRLLNASFLPAFVL